MNFCLLEKTWVVIYGPYLVHSTHFFNFSFLISSIAWNKIKVEWLQKYPVYMQAWKLPVQP